MKHYSKHGQCRPLEAKTTIAKKVLGLRPRHHTRVSVCGAFCIIHQRVSDLPSPIRSL